MDFDSLFLYSSGLLRPDIALTRTVMLISPGIYDLSRQRWWFICFGCTTVSEEQSTGRFCIVSRQRAGDEGTSAGDGSLQLLAL